MFLCFRRETGCFQKLKMPLFKNGGFTLPEVLTVVSIIGILAAVAVPVFGSWNKSKQLSGFGRNLYAHMQLAKLQSIRNNCNVVISIPNANSYEVFLDDGGPTGAGVADNDTREGDEIVVVSATTPGDVVIQIANADFGGTTTPGFTSRALPVQNRTGSVVLRRNGRTDRWYRVTLSPSGQLDLQKSTDSTDGEDGNWK